MGGCVDDLIALVGVEDVSSRRLGGEALTLGTRKVTLLLAGSNSTVDVTPEGSIAKVADLVVGLDVLLDSLTAVGAESA